MPSLRYNRKRWVPSLLITAALLFCPLSAFPLGPSALSLLHRHKISKTRKLHPSRSFSLHSSANDQPSQGAAISSAKLYFDIAISTTPIGRLTFVVPAATQNVLPLHTSNLIALASSARASIDPKATYRNCDFQYTPSTIEDGSMRYRWGHVCEGRGKTGITQGGSRGEEAIRDPEGLNKCKHNCFGGTYYGLSYADVLEMIEQSTRSDVNDSAKDGVVEKQAVLLTTPMQPTSKFSLVRVSESPREWGERLLLNCAVLGYLDCNRGSGVNHNTANGVSSLDVLRAMARQRVGPPKIVDCGVL